MNTIMQRITMQKAVKAAFYRVFVTIACPYKNRLPFFMEETIRQAVNDV
jgi:hypothetical protein